MDTELARTFLTVVAAGSISGAAERLGVRQSTISARVRALEEQLGARLLVRNKAGTRLTGAGQQFQRHAAQLVRTVEKARQELGTPRGFRAALTVGARFGLWEQLMLAWLPRMRAAHPDVSLRAEVGFEPDLMADLVAGSLDLALMYTPEARPGLVTELLFEERLVMVSDRADAAPAPGADYVHVDWGPEFEARLSVRWPDRAPPALTVVIGWLGVQYLLANGGCGYFPERLLASALDAGRLHRVRDAHSFRLPAYVVYAETRDRTLVDPAVALIHGLADGVAPPPRPRA